MILDELQFIRKEREAEHKRLVAEREANIINMGLYKYRLKQKVLSVMKEIDLDVNMLNKMKEVIMKVRLDEVQSLPLNYMTL